MFCFPCTYTLAKSVNKLLICPLFRFQKMYIHIHLYMYIYTYFLYLYLCKEWYQKTTHFVVDVDFQKNECTHVDRKKSPPGGFPKYYVPLSIHYVPLSRTGRKRTPPEEPPPKMDHFWGWFSRGAPLPPGSWSGNIVNRKPPRRGPERGFLSINMGQDTVSR